MYVEIPAVALGILMIGRGEDSTILTHSIEQFHHGPCGQFSNYTWISPHLCKSTRRNNSQMAVAFYQKTPHKDSLSQHTAHSGRESKTVGSDVLFRVFKPSFLSIAPLLFGVIILLVAIHCRVIEEKTTSN